MLQACFYIIDIYKEMLNEEMPPALLSKLVLKLYLEMKDGNLDSLSLRSSQYFAIKQSPR